MYEEREIEEIFTEAAELVRKTEALAERLWHQYGKELLGRALLAAAKGDTTEAQQQLSYLEQDMRRLTSRVVTTKERFSSGEIDALTKRALREGRLYPYKVTDFRAALQKGHVPFFTEAEVRQAAKDGLIPEGEVEGLIEIVNLPDIAMYNPQAAKRAPGRRDVTLFGVFNLAKYGH